MEFFGQCIIIVLYHSVTQKLNIIKQLLQSLRIVWPSVLHLFCTLWLWHQNCTAGCR